jgi:hypothetical protein
MLTLGAIEAIEKNGDQAQKALYLPKLVSGEWTGTMNLTEPQAGSDLGALTTRAEPDGNGGWRLTGQKIFITWGDHDMTDNIVHLVLARLPNAPPGSRGNSLFLAPKRQVNPDGSLGGPNGVTCGSSTSSASTARPPASCFTKAPGPSWSARPTPGWRPCS